MKKALLCLGIAGILSVAQNANAQVWSENFDNGFPATWILHNVDAKTPYATYAYVTDAWVIRVKTNAANNPIPGDSIIVSTSWYNPVGQADDWVVTDAFTVNDANTFLRWDERAFNPAYPDGFEVRVSTTGSAVADFTDLIHTSNPANIGEFATRGVSLGTYNGQTIRLAFRNNSNDKELLGLDNIVTEVIAAGTDVTVNEVILPKIATDFIAADGVPVKVKVTNKGNQPVTSLDLQYAVNAGTPVTQNFTGLNIPTYGSATLTFTTNLSGVAVGNQSITAEATLVNTVADVNPGDNQATASFIGATQRVDRPCFMEEFTSSTCGPCASFNVNFDPLVLANGGNTAGSGFNIIKYQMNWPAPGNDSSYNSHASVRRNYYGVNSIPDHMTNGAQGGSGNQAEIDACKVGDGFIGIAGTYTVTNDSIYANVSVTPYFSNSGTYKVHIAAVEKNYGNPYATTSQEAYYHVMRRMFPNGGGSAVGSWTAGTPVNYDFKAPYDVWHVRQQNFNFWTHPKNSNLIVFVQDETSRTVLQSKVIEAQWPTTVSEKQSGISRVVLFPNPAVDRAAVTFQLDKTTDVQLLVTDALGRVVYNANNAKMSAGEQMIGIPTGNLATGVYNVKLVSANGSVSQNLSVIK